MCTSNEKMSIESRIFFIIHLPSLKLQVDTKIYILQYMNISKWSYPVGCDEYCVLRSSKMDFSFWTVGDGVNEGAVINGISFEGDKLGRLYPPSQSISRRLWVYVGTDGETAEEVDPWISELDPSNFGPELSINIFEESVSPLDLLAGGPKCIGFKHCIVCFWPLLQLFPRVLSYLFERLFNEDLLPLFSLSINSSSLIPSKVCDKRM